MRTYTRKKPEYKFIENVHEMCRLCMGKRMESMPIFPSEADNVCISLALRIMICVGLEITEEECLPNMICKECFEELNKYYSFRKKCAHAYQKLKSHVLAVAEMKITKVASPQESNNNVQPDINHGSSQKEIALAINEDNQLLTNIDNDKAENKLNHKIETKLFSNELDDNIVSPDISEFLSTILIKLEILTKQDELFIGADLNERTIELETGDGCQITLELLECEENEKCHSGTESYVNNANQDQSPTSYAHDHRTMSKPIDGRPQCAECGKRFATRTVLRRHALVHTGEKPYACYVCPRRFAQREVLRRHQLVHDVQRPYACSACPKSFTQRGALAAHARSHAPAHARALQLHRCPQCPKMFLHASGLSRHLAGHAGRVHPCGTCDRQFRDRSSLRRHLLRTRHAQHPQGALDPRGQPGRLPRPEEPAQPTTEQPTQHEQLVQPTGATYPQLIAAPHVANASLAAHAPLAAHAQYAQLVQHTQMDA